MTDNASSTVGAYLASRLEQIGLRHYFAVPGDYNLVLLDELLTNPRLQMISCCNELNAGYAADGYARATGGAAAVVVTRRAVSTATRTTRPSRGTTAGPVAAVAPAC